MILKCPNLQFKACEGLGTTQGGCDADENLGVAVMMMKLVVATRNSETDFFQKTAMGRSLSFFSPPNLDVEIHFNNTRGLSSVYNDAICACTESPAILVFAHDDLHLLDYFWCDRIKEGLAVFDVIGLAGNKRRLPHQPSWLFTDPQFKRDSPENLSGAVAHGRDFSSRHLAYFGAPRQQVKLLDGLLLAARSEVLLENEVLFDERFDFHFYDLDFCRQAEQKGLSCGTWDISLIHESVGAFGTPEWQSAYQRYIAKWGD